MVTQALTPWNVTTVNSYDISAADQNLTTDDLLINQIVVVTNGGNGTYGLVVPTATALKAAASPLVNAAFRVKIVGDPDHTFGAVLKTNTGITVITSGTDLGGGLIAILTGPGSGDLVGVFTNVGGTPAVTLYF